MTLDEQHKFFLERPTPTTPIQINVAPTQSTEREWKDYNNDTPNLAGRLRWEVRWKPEPKTVPAWPDVKPYWVRIIPGSRIRTVDVYDRDHILLGGAAFRLEELTKEWEWTTDFKTWHPFTKEVEE